MKHFAMYFLILLGAAGSTLSWADETNPEEVYRATIGSDGVQHVPILGGNYFFRPNRIIVKANTPVELTVTVEKGVTPHSLVIQSPEAGISVDQNLSSQPSIIRFTPTAAGSYPFYCKKKLLFFKSHREKGMKGVLEVIQ